jgi:predicted permease
MLHDLKHAVRMLMQSKGWTLVVLLSLAIGIGATTALFTAVNGMLLQSVPLPEPEALVRLAAVGDNSMRRSSSDYGFSQFHEGQSVRPSFSYAGWQALRQANQTLNDVAAFAPTDAINVIVKGTAEIASGFLVSGNFFNTLRVPVSMGRAIVEADDRPGAQAVAVISETFWRRRFGADPAVVGQAFRMNNTPVTIVGVTASSYTGVLRLGSAPPDVTIPFATDVQVNPSQAKRYQEPTSWWLLTMGRLKPGVTLPQVVGNLEGAFQASARAGMEAFINSLTPEQKGLSINQPRGASVPAFLARSAQHGMYDADRTSRRSAAIVSVVVTILLLIVCANVANLLLSRGSARHREISVRLSMGASRWRLIRQLLTESLLLSSVGGALGIAVAYWSKSLLPFGENAPIDLWVVLFVAGVTVLTGLLFGLGPAFRTTGVELASAMKESSRTVAGGRAWLGKSLLVVQVALSIVLLIGAGLFLRTLYNLRSVDVGFNANNLLMFRINPQANQYQNDRIPALYRRVNQELATLPGVQSVALTRTTLLSGGQSTTRIHIQGKAEPNDIHVMSVSPEFFATLQIPVLAGRGFAERDLATPQSVVIVNQTAVKQFFDGPDAVGARLGSTPEGAAAGEHEVVGVIKDTKYSNLRDAAPPTMYRVLRNDAASATVMVRTAGDPAAMIDSVRATLQKIDPELPLINVTTQTDQIEGRVAQERLFALAYTLFGALALLLASIGLFGLMSYNVSRRTSEIGIRMALGAQRTGVIGMILRESMLMVAVGAVIGLAGAFAAGRYIESVLFGLSKTDAWTIGAVIVLTTLVSLAAGYLPARRAARVDPMVALRYEG